MVRRPHLTTLAENIINSKLSLMNFLLNRVYPTQLENDSLDCDTNNEPLNQKGGFGTVRLTVYLRLGE